MNDLHEITIASLIWWLGGTVRYLSSMLINNQEIKMRELLLRPLVSGGFGVLIYWVASSLQAKYNFDTRVVFSIVYVGWMLAPQMIKSIVMKWPDMFTTILDLLSKMLQKKWETM